MNTHLEEYALATLCQTWRWMGEDLNAYVYKLIEVHHILEQDITYNAYTENLISDGRFITYQIRHISQQRTIFWMDLANIIEIRGPFMDRSIARIVFGYVDPVEERELIHDLYRTQWRAENQLRLENANMMEQ